MPHDLEQPDERTKLLSHVANDRRLSAVQQEDDAQSVIYSQVSKDEQALASTSVGERLPYNDYTTIDWLHDLVRYAIHSMASPIDRGCRSKTPIAVGPFIPEKASAMACFRSSTHVPAGSQPPSSASSLPASPSLSTLQKLQ